MRGCRGAKKKNSHTYTHAHNAIVSNKDEKKKHTLDNTEIEKIFFWMGMTIMGVVKWQKTVYIPILFSLYVTWKFYIQNKQ